MDKNETYLKGIRDELHQTNIFLGHLCKVMDALLVESDNTMRDANIRVDYDPRVTVDGYDPNIPDKNFRNAMLSNASIG